MLVIKAVKALIHQSVIISSHQYQWTKCFVLPLGRLVQSVAATYVAKLAIPHIFTPYTKL